MQTHRVLKGKARAIRRILFPPDTMAARFWQPIPNFKGVYRTTDVARPYKVAVQRGANDNVIIIGFYKDLTQAAVAYDAAARDLFRYPLLNFPKPGELSVQQPEFKGLHVPRRKSNIESADCPVGDRAHWQS